MDLQTRRLTDLPRASAVGLDTHITHAPGSVPDMGDPLIETRPVGLGDLAELATLFADQRNTRKCWCMAFCTSRSRFAIGWLTGEIAAVSRR